MVAREAMAYGRPVVATRVGGLADAIEDGVTGVLVDATSGTPELRSHVEHLLGDREARRQMGGAAKELAKRHQIACRGPVLLRTLEGRGHGPK
jgi:glycosyltransferase involved in cell wall biosynthesis